MTFVRYALRKTLCNNNINQTRLHGPKSLHSLGFCKVDFLKEIVELSTAIFRCRWSHSIYMGRDNFWRCWARFNVKKKSPKTLCLQFKETTSTSRTLGLLRFSIHKNTCSCQVFMASIFFHTTFVFKIALEFSGCPFFIQYLKFLII